MEQCHQLFGGPNQWLVGGACRGPIHEPKALLMDEAMVVSNWIAVMNGGEIIQFGTPEESMISSGINLLPNF